MKYSIEEKNLKESIIINILTFILTLAGCIIMFTGFKFMYGTGPALETTKFGVFKFFTVDSNVFISNELTITLPNTCDYKLDE